jgi:hypothetical protein
MQPEPGEIVTIVDAWPIRPGSAVSLQPGDTGTVVRSNDRYCAVEVLGTVVVIPVSKIRRSGGTEWWVE